MGERALASNVTSVVSTSSISFSDAELSCCCRFLVFAFWDKNAGANETLAMGLESLGFSVSWLSVVGGCAGNKDDLDERVVGRTTGGGICVARRN